MRLSFALPSMAAMPPIPTSTTGFSSHIRQDNWGSYSNPRSRFLWLLRCSRDCIPSRLHAFAHNSQFLFLAFGSQQGSMVFFYTETNRITNLDLLFPGTFACRGHV